MRIEQLQYLTAITELGSLRRASEHLHVSQSGMSEAIAKLERELGVALLDRQRTGSRISLAGRELLQPIVDVLESVERLKAAAGDQLAAQRLLRIGSVNAGTATLLLPAARAFQSQHPGCTVDIRTMQQPDIELGLREGTLDLGLVNLLDGDDTPPHLDHHRLYTGRPVAVLPAGHPLADLPEVTVDDLRGERFVAMRAGFVMYRFAHRMFGAHPPAEWNTTDGAEMGKLMVAEGIGVTVLPDYSVIGDPLERGGLVVVRPIAGTTTTVTMVVVYRRQRRLPAALREMLEHLSGQASRPLAAVPA